MATDLEFLREVLSDNRMHLSLALVEKVETLDDGSLARCQVKTLPAELELVATVTWDACSAGGGTFTLPDVKDLVLVAFTSPDEAFVVRRLSSKEDKVPAPVKDGHTVIKAKDGKKVLVGKSGDSEPDEPMVLGNVAKSCLNDVFTKLDTLLTKLISGPLVICGSPGSAGSTFPALATDLGTIKTELATLKSQYLDTANSNILSQTAFIER